MRTKSFKKKENLQQRKLQHQKIYSIRKSTANQQRISTAKTAKKENLQQKKLQHQKIYSKTSREFLQRKQRRKKIYSKRKTTAPEKSTAKSTIFTSNGEQRKAIYSIISDKLHKALTKDYIKRVTFQEEFKNHFQQDPGH